MPIVARQLPKLARCAAGTRSQFGETVPAAIRAPACWKVEVKKATCGAVKFVKFCGNGRKGKGVPGPMARLEVMLAETLLVKNPDSCRRRCSKLVKKKVRSSLIGPPSVAPYCTRVKPGFLFGSLSIIGASPLRA